MNSRFVKKTVLIVLFALSLDIFLQHQLMERLKNDRIVSVSSQLATLRARIEKGITGNLLLIQGSANFISLNPDISSETFSRYAQEVMRRPNLLRNLGALPDFVFTYVYPLEGNEAVIGVDLRKVPSQWEQARLAEETGEMVVAGPLKLMQGGSGLIGRAPVYVRDQNEKRFWGLVSAVIDADLLFKEVGVDKLSDLHLAMRGMNGKGAGGDVFFGDPELFNPEKEAVLMPVTFPSGSWQIAAVAKEKIPVIPPLGLLVHGLLALLVGAAVFASYKSMRKNQEIERVRERLNKAQAIAHMGNWELDLTTDSLWWSDETYRIAGVSRDAPIWLDTFKDLVHPDDRAIVKDAYARSRDTGEPFALDHRIVRPDGSVRYIHQQGITEFDGDGKSIRMTGAVVDITDRRLAEEALREIKERYEHITHYLRNRVVFFTHSFDGGLLYASDGFHLLSDLSIEEALGAKWGEIINWTPDSRSYIRDQNKSLICSINTSVEFEVSYIDPAGAERHLAIYEYAAFSSERNDYVIEGIAIDITDQKAKEAELRVLNRAIENAPVSVVITDMKGVITYVNPHFSMVTGYLREEAVGQNPRVLKSGKHEPEFYLRMWETIASGRTWRGEIVNKKKDGGLYWESASISPICDERGETISYVAVKDDISDKKDLERLKEDVDRIMRHDLKTPLNAIIGFPQLIEMTGDLGEEQLDMLKSIEESGITMLQMIDNSLDLFKMETGSYEYSPTPVDVLPIIAQLGEHCSSKLSEKGLTLRVFVDGKEPDSEQTFIFEAEERLLYQLLSNLLVNAIEASPQKQEIIFEITNGAPRIISIANKGTVPEEVREHFFEKYKTFGKKTGTGLGTYSAKLLARTMSYGIQMSTSDEENYTSIEIVIPSAQAYEDKIAGSSEADFSASVDWAAREASIGTKFK